MVARHLAVGRAGEDTATSFLLSKGYTILERNYRCRQGEIDLIAERDECIVFVEVKTRVHAGLEAAIQAVDQKKRRRLISAAALFLSERALWDHACRFDIIVVQPYQGHDLCKHFENAFEGDMTTGSSDMYSPF
ncbi:YraN family protein [Desulfovibrio inopinatus]|uniref:YraN family protein n=1 Tax=Desulfovibrio inopinatus TaxID=102109 RepID=UPI000414F033|nr:YraN family protein [Desulfovibrio inopinatus]